MTLSPKTQDLQTFELEAESEVPVLFFLSPPKSVFSSVPQNLFLLIV